MSARVSRLTFREKVDVAWQKQLRDKHLDEGCPADDLSLKSAVVKPVTYQLAKQIILKYEWLGTMAATGYHYGLFFGLHCAGVCCYSVGSGTGGVNTHKPFNIKRKELSVLARGACVHWAPPGANSKLVSISAKLLGKSTPVKIIIAYSDTDAGEIGTIYQACNWTCIGRGASTKQWVSPKGRVMDQKLPWNLKQQHGGTRMDWVKRLESNGWTQQKTNPKYRYVYITDKKDKQLAKIVADMEVPYPKRASG